MNLDSWMALAIGVHSTQDWSTRSIWLVESTLQLDDVRVFTVHVMSCSWARECPYCVFFDFQEEFMQMDAAPKVLLYHAVTGQQGKHVGEKCVIDWLFAVVYKKQRMFEFSTSHISRMCEGSFLGQRNWSWCSAKSSSCCIAGWVSVHLSDVFILQLLPNDDCWIHISSIGHNACVLLTSI